ncbi:MAG: U32 family peptidase [Deltaproteobacteria bacterium]|nr:U32 family peptidase [Deltaproteobacteria bacterium]
MQNNDPRPEILAPAGNRESFLAALAAGADAVYCGLKHFSARMEADNFSLAELAGLTSLARNLDRRVYVTLNTLLKPGEESKIGRLVDRLRAMVKPHGLIVQDLAMSDLARQAGFEGEIHFSTLANVSFLSGLRVARALGADRVVLPRELDVDEIKDMARACPQGLGLEIFVHGALCYAVSGRCYWSSYLGGKSGLRGRCVQPCRRLYREGRENGRFFSCQDLGLGPLVKTIRDIPNIKAWKIEGRKKGPHYVYHTVKAYSLLRDHSDDPQVRKSAQEFLDRALGRPSTNFNFLGHRAKNPTDNDGRTASGLMIGSIQGTPQKPWLSPREELLPGDTLRIGFEDQPGHSVVRIRAFSPAGKRFPLSLPKDARPEKNTSVFLVDRREKGLLDALRDMENRMPAIKDEPARESSFTPKLPTPRPFRSRSGRRPETMHLFRKAPKSLGPNAALWCKPGPPDPMPRGQYAKIWWWLPPVLWPNQQNDWQKAVNALLKVDAERFVLNSPWQMALFPDQGRGLRIWAGPFCNLANAMAIEAVRQLGCCGAIVSPELDRESFLNLSDQSPIPLGVVTRGHWPQAISRILPSRPRTAVPIDSPKGEQSWIIQYGPDTWVYPNWGIDLRDQENELLEAGYTMLVSMHEPLPKRVRLKDRPGTWNWSLRLL